MKSKRSFCVLLVAISAALVAFSHGDTPAMQPAAEEVELAPYMSRLQHFSQKLGYSIDGKNQPLAAFYLEEIEEGVEAIIKEVPFHDGLPIAEVTQTILMPAIAPVEQAIAVKDWPAARQRYVQMIDTCNRCHTATQHEFIVITPAEGVPPFNQKFEAP